MKRFEVLNQLNDHKLSTAQAYKLLYGYQFKMKKAHFVKLRITIKDEKKVTAFLKVLFLFPIPLFLIKIIIKMAMKKGKGNIDQIPLSTNELIELASYRGLLVNVDAHDDTNILIKTI
ncbi:MAG: hypothetical protein AB7E61_05175 [Acholeplasmataceae bacterium]